MVAQGQFKATMFGLVPFIVVVMVEVKSVVIDEIVAQTSFPDRYPKASSKFSQGQSQEAFQVILHPDSTIDSKFNQGRIQVAFQVIHGPNHRLANQALLKVDFMVIITVEIDQFIVVFKFKVLEQVGLPCGQLGLIQ